MGFISSMQTKSTTPAGAALDARRRWRMFNRVKEEVQREDERIGGYRSSVSTGVAQARLLKALRSSAPGTWTDDRWAESQSFQGIVYIAIHRICVQLQQAEFQVFRKDKRHPDGKIPVTEDDDAYGLVDLLEKPNKTDSFGQYMYRVGQQKWLTGSALTWLVPNRTGDKIVEMYCIPTATAIPQAVVTTEYPEGYYRIQPYYPYGPFSSYPTPATSVGAAIPAEWVMAMRFPHPIVYYDGFSPLTALRLHIDEVTSIDRSRWYKMRRDINPTAVLNSTDGDGQEPLPEPEIDRIHAEFENNFMGPENAGRLIVGSPGFKLEPFGSSPKDMDYSQGWDQLTQFVHAGLGITKEAAGMLGTSSYAALFAAMKQLHLMTLQPECDNLASQLTRQLAKYWGDDIIIEIRCKRVDDPEVMSRKLQMLIGAKAIKKNALLRALEMPTTMEEWGEDFAGDPTPYEKEQQQQAQQAQAGGGMPGGEMGGMPGVGSPGMGAMLAGESGAAPAPPGMGGDIDQMMMEGAEPEDPDEAPEPPALAQGRPDTGSLGQNALGPRGKFLQPAHGSNKDAPLSRFRLYKMLGAGIARRIQNNLNGSLHNGK